MNNPWMIVFEQLFGGIVEKKPLKFGMTTPGTIRVGKDSLPTFSENFGINLK